MILNRLIDYYDILASQEDCDIPKLYYKKEGISFALVISPAGELLGLEDLRVKPENGSKLIPKSILIPETAKKTSGISPNFLSGNSSYVLGLSVKNNDERSLKEHIEFKEFHRMMLKGVDAEEAESVLSFIDNWDYKESLIHPVLKDYKDIFKTAVFTFRVDGKERFVHENKEIRHSWESYRNQKTSEVTGQSLITGEVKPIARLHSNISGITDTLSSGASLVSFNKAAFESYGKSQSYNSPIDEISAFKYSTTLNYLLKDRRHKITVGDTTLVFWAEIPNLDRNEESIFKEMLIPETIPSEEDRNDSSTTFLVSKILESIKRGYSITDISGIDENLNFYILGFAPNASRVSLRFFMHNSFGMTLRNLGKHYLDMEIIKSNSGKRVINIYDILRELSPNKDLKRISPLLAGQLTECILHGRYYGDGPYLQMLQRIKADQEVNEIRCAFVKACLIRKLENKSMKGVMTMGLNENNHNNGYLLGRLFAVLEKSQLDVSRSLNRTIKDTYFSSAMTTPSSIFPILIRLSQYHIEKSDYGGLRDKEIQKIIFEIEEFPINLDMYEQGQFVLGYYHQKENYYPAKTVNNKVEVTE